MIFLSQIIRASIFDTRDELVGRMLDVVASADGSKYPIVKGIVFSDKGRICFIPYQQIENISRSAITLKRSNCWKVDYEYAAHDFLLLRDVLDQQIFDVKGIRVVRVNDLQLARIEDKMSVLGIDISNRALVRRLGLNWLPFTSHLQAKFIDWDNIGLVNGRIGSLKLKTPHEKLQELHPADIANLIENLTIHESSKLVQSFDEETAAEVLGEVEPQYKDTLLENINPKNLASILEEMPNDEAADVIRDLSEHKRLQVFKKLGIRKAKFLHKLTKYNDDSAGGLMTSEFLSVHRDFTAAQAIQLLRKVSENYRSIYHVFIVDDDKHLEGIVSIRTLLLADHRKKMADLMAKVMNSVRIHTRAEEVARLMTKYDLLSVVVLDKNKVLKGIITVDDILRFLVPDA